MVGLCSVLHLTLISSPAHTLPIERHSWRYSEVIFERLLSILARREVAGAGSSRQVRLLVQVSEKKRIKHPSVRAGIRGG